MLVLQWRGGGEGKERERERDEVGEVRGGNESDMFQ